MLNTPEIPPTYLFQVSATLELARIEETSIERALNVSSHLIACWAALYRYF
jgi:hypothetical protein